MIEETGFTGGKGLHSETGCRARCGEEGMQVLPPAKAFIKDFSHQDSNSDFFISWTVTSLLISQCVKRALSLEVARVWVLSIGL
jgi:hypothetical protein